jgi:hypothetical protein
VDRAYIVALDAFIGAFIGAFIVLAARRPPACAMGRKRRSSFFLLDTLRST